MAELPTHRRTLAASPRTYRRCRWIRSPPLPGTGTPLLNRSIPRQLERVRQRIWRRRQGSQSGRFDATGRSPRPEQRQSDRPPGALGQSRMDRPAHGEAGPAGHLSDHRQEYVGDSGAKCHRPQSHPGRRHGSGHRAASDQRAEYADLGSGHHAAPPGKAHRFAIVARNARRPGLPGVRQLHRHVAGAHPRSRAQAAIEDRRSRTRFCWATPPRSP